MPRQARIDSSGALHHIMVRGVDKQKIFADDEDRKSFLDRLAVILTETKTACYAWALLPNHFHLLLRTGNVPVTTVMRRLLTGHAQYFNRKHKRKGHLFQNRYKSILSQEDTYMLELVRYIHLNPLRTGLVKTLDDLDSYPYSGHPVIMGQREASFEDTGHVLKYFASKTGYARKKYREFVSAGISKGKRTDLTGGGLVRSAGGWQSVLARRSKGIKLKGDERILGDSDFVLSTLQKSDEELDRRMQLKIKGYDIKKLALRVKQLLGKNPLTSPGKYRSSVEARRLFCYWAVRELGISATQVGRHLGLTQSAVSVSVKHGEKIVEEKGFNLYQE
jgi:putative transposase